MKYIIYYTNGTKEIKEFENYQKCVDYCYSQGDHVVTFRRYNT